MITLISAVPSSGGFAAIYRSIHSYTASYNFLLSAESLQYPATVGQQVTSPCQEAVSTDGGRRRIRCSPDAQSRGWLYGKHAAVAAPVPYIGCWRSLSADIYTRDCHCPEASFVNLASLPFTSHNKLLSSAVSRGDVEQGYVYITRT